MDHGEEGQEEEEEAGDVAVDLALCGGPTGPRSVMKCRIESTLNNHFRVTSDSLTHSLSSWTPGRRPRRRTRRRATRRLARSPVNPVEIYDEMSNRIDS